MHLDTIFLAEGKIYLSPASGWMRVLIKAAVLFGTNVHVLQLLLIRYLIRLSAYDEQCNIGRYV